MQYFTCRHLRHHGCLWGVSNDVVALLMRWYSHPAKKNIRESIDLIGEERGSREAFWRRSWKKEVLGRSRRGEKKFSRRFWWSCWRKEVLGRSRRGEKKFSRRFWWSFWRKEVEGRRGSTQDRDFYRFVRSKRFSWAVFVSSTTEKRNFIVRFFITAPKWRVPGRTKLIVMPLQWVAYCRPCCSLEETISNRRLWFSLLFLRSRR